MNDAHGNHDDRDHESDIFSPDVWDSMQRIVCDHNPALDATALKGRVRIHARAGHQIGIPAYWSTWVCCDFRPALGRISDEKSCLDGELASYWLTRIMCQSS